MFVASKPITKPFTGVNPPIVEDVLGDELLRDNKYQDFSDRFGKSEYVLKKQNLFDRRRNHRRSLEDVFRDTQKSLRVSPVFWSKRKLSNFKTNKIESKGIGLLIKPPVKLNDKIGNLKITPRTNFKPKILEKPRMSRASAPNLSTSYTNPLKLKSKFLM